MYKHLKKLIFGKIIDFVNFVEQFDSIFSYTFYMNILNKLKKF